MDLRSFSFAVCCLPLLAAPAAWADTYAYLSEGERGEPSFSDLASPSAKRIELPEFHTAPISSTEQIEQMLRVANDLAVARQAREAARAARRQPAPAPVSAEPEQSRNHIGYPWRGYRYAYPRHRYPHHRGESPAPEPERSSKTFRFRPNL